MALTTTEMGLRVWNLLTDLYDHTQLADNWSKVDLHDHSPGKGVPIPTDGIADGAITGPKLDTSIDPSGAYTSYHPIKFGLMQFGSSVAAGQYVLGEPNPLNIAVSSGLWSSNPIFYLDPADYLAAGRTLRYRMRSTLITQGILPNSDFTVALYPVSSIAAYIPTLGTMVPGSNVTFTAPAINSLLKLDSTDFTPPVAGFYIMTAQNTATTNAGVTIRSTLAMHNV